jgi:hypothetical protein
VVAGHQRGQDANVASQHIGIHFSSPSTNTDHVLAEQKSSAEAPKGIFNRGVIRENEGIVHAMVMPHAHMQILRRMQYPKPTLAHHPPPLPIVQIALSQTPFRCIKSVFSIVCRSRTSE